MVTSGRPVCVKCNVEMICVKNGAVVERMGPVGPRALQACDKYKCPVCGIEVMAAFGQTCMVDSWETGRYAPIRQFENNQYPITLAWINVSDKEEYERREKARSQVSAG